MQIPEYIIIALWAVIAFFASKSLIPVLLTVAKQKGLFDDESNRRKLHEGNIPNFGGIAIFTAFMVIYPASSYAGLFTGYEYVVSGSILLFAAGLKDDLIVIAAHKKLALQITAAALIMFGAGVTIDNLGGVFGMYEVGPWVEIPLTLFTIVVVVNSMNLIDGIDGLAGAIGIFASIFFGVWFYMAGLNHLAAFSFILTAAIGGFLWYNRPPAKIFMGDTGSLVIGFFLSILAIKFVQFSISEPGVVFWQPAAPVIVASVLVVPLYDTLRVFIIRKIKGFSAFEPDNGHIHHQLLDVGLSHGKIVMVLLSLNIIITSSIILLTPYLSNTLLLVVLLALTVLLFPTHYFKRKLIEPFMSESIKEKLSNGSENGIEKILDDPEHASEPEVKHSKEKKQVDEIEI